MQDMLPGVLSIVLILLGPTVTNSSSLPIECRTTVNSSVLHSSFGLSMSRLVPCWAITTFSKMEGIVSKISKIELLLYQMTNTQYSIGLNTPDRFDTSYPTGGYGVSGD
ncbi:hypothetical protein Tco_0905252 [Tanacetum coccineum]